jgi:hypothetical protein
VDGPSAEAQGEGTMGAPVNVKIENPTDVAEDWQRQAAQWKALNEEIGGHPQFFPLTIKAAYVIGVVHDICESVSYLREVPRNVRHVTYLPAYGVFASGVEILGRCVRGNSSLRDSTEDLKTGFKWLTSSSYESVSDNYVLVKTSTSAYTILMLTALRHFAAHGQATSKQMDEDTYAFGSVIDYQILSKMPPLIAGGLERYWSALQNSELLCNRLARANIIALRNWPLFRSWSLFQGGEPGVYPSLTEVFNAFDWGRVHWLV